jgi:hypothetical protein
MRAKHISAILPNFYLYAKYANSTIKDPFGCCFSSFLIIFLSIILYGEEGDDDFTAVVDLETAAAALVLLQLLLFLDGDPFATPDLSSIFRYQSYLPKGIKSLNPDLHTHVSYHRTELQTYMA